MTVLFESNDPECMVKCTAKASARFTVTGAIVLNHGIRDITIGMTYPQVQALSRGMITPDSRFWEPHHFVRTERYKRGPMSPVELAVVLSSTRSMASAKVTSVGALLRFDLINGVGVGDTESTLRGAVPHLICSRDKYGNHQCKTAKERIGKIVTYFQFARGTDRVHAIYVCKVTRFLQGFPMCD